MTSISSPLLGYGTSLEKHTHCDEGGMLANVGVGWQKMFRPHFGINCQVSLQYHQFRSYEFEPGRPDIDSGRVVSGGYNFVGFGFGFVF